MFTLIDNLKDPCIHYHNDEMRLTSFIIQVPLDSISILFHDWQTGDITDYDTMIEKLNNIELKFVASKLHGITPEDVTLINKLLQTG